jgi:nicotinamide-nucleotide amidase
MSLRAGIVVTGTEVLTGRVNDRNGPWLAERLYEVGVELAYTLIVADRPADMEAALTFMAANHVNVVITSGGLGPTADDLTAEVVGRFQGHEMVLDEALEERIAKIVEPLRRRWPKVDVAAIETGTRKQATVPAGARILEPVGTAPGLVVPPADQSPGPMIVVLPGPPRELQPMWRDALSADILKATLSDATVFRQQTMRLFGMPESEIAETLRAAARAGLELEGLEVTTCLKRGEVEVVTRYEPDRQQAYEALEEFVAERHRDTLFSVDGSSVDAQVAALLRGERVLDGVRIAPEPAGGERAGGLLTIATAESCTGGLLAARLTDLPGSSEYMRGAIVAYSNDAKVALAAVPAALVERHGAVSAEVAEALADGARSEVGADIGVGVTGVAGPGGGTEEKPIGLVWLSVAGPGGARLTRSVNLPGGRADVRDRTTAVAMHLARRLLLDLRSPTATPPEH